MELLTRRFVLRDFVDDDAPAFEAYHQDPRSLEFYDAGEAGPGHARELIKLFRTWAAEQPRLNYQLAIVQRSAPQALVGCCGLRCAASEPGEAELGIELAPAYWGRYAYAAEILQALVALGFGELRLQAIHGNTVSANARVGRLVQAFGATAVRRPTPEWMAAKGWEQIEWRVSRDQWESGRLTKPSSRRAGARG